MVKNRSDYSLKILSDHFYNQETEDIETKYTKDQIFKKFYKYEKSEIEKTIKKFKHLIKSENIDKLKKDMIRSKYTLKASFDDYFMLNFMNKNHDERSKYITRWYRHKYYNYLNDPNYRSLYLDKYKTYNIYKNFYKREIILIKSLSEYKKFKNFLDKHKIVIKKPYNNSFWIWVEIVKALDVSKALLKKYLKQSWKFVLEEIIEQSDKMKLLHPESVNTVRIFGYTDGKIDNVTICFPFIRMGKWLSIVDNWWAWWIFAAVDINGIIITDWIDELWNKYKFHPDTWVKIKWLKLPDWNSAKDIVKKASLMDKHTKLIWRDLAHKKSWRVIVEWNSRWHFLWQVATQEWMKKDFEKMINLDSMKNIEEYPFCNRRSKKYL